MFQFRPFPTYAYFIQRTLTHSSCAGFPHSEISGSKPICGSPKLIAACHVLRRLLMPRHPPCALCRLTSSSLFREVVSGSQVIFENYASSINSCCLKLMRYPTKLQCFPHFYLVTLLFSFLLSLSLVSLNPLFSSQGAIGRRLCALRIKQCDERSRKADLRNSVGLVNQHVSLERR